MVTMKRIIIITGTPGVGKTSVARLLSSKIRATHVNLTELAEKERLIIEFDQARNSKVIDETKIKEKLIEILGCSRGDIVVDGHYAVFVTPKEHVTHVFVLRRDPIELKRLLEKRGFSGQKLWENLAAEILDVCLVDSLNLMPEGVKICEIDVTDKAFSRVVEYVLAVLRGEEECLLGVVDWLEKLEQRGVLEEYLRI